MSPGLHHQVLFRADVAEALVGFLRPGSLELAAESEG